jgi:hypothetical protein
VAFATFDERRFILSANLFLVGQVPARRWYIRLAPKSGPRSRGPRSTRSAWRDTISIVLYPRPRSPEPLRTLAASRPRLWWRPNSPSAFGSGA